MNNTSLTSTATTRNADNNIQPQTQTAHASNASNSQPNTHHQQNPHVSHTHPALSQQFSRNTFNDFAHDLRHREQIWKWNLSYSGDNPKASASEFLQLINDRAFFRRVSHEEILMSMTDLLTGTALRWYRNNLTLNPFTNWNDFTKRFIQDFEPSHQSEMLLEHIRNRQQQPNESVVKYFAEIEDLFLRLPFVPQDITRIKILRKNILPEYIQALALFSCETVEELRNACKKLELGKAMSNQRYQSVPAQYYQQSQPSYNPRPQFNHRPQYNNNNQNFNNFSHSYNQNSNQYPQRNNNNNYQFPRQQFENNNQRQFSRENLSNNQRQLPQQNYENRNNNNQNNNNNFSQNFRPQNNNNNSMPPPRNQNVQVNSIEASSITNNSAMENQNPQPIASTSHSNSEN